MNKVILFGFLMLISAIGFQSCKDGDGDDAPNTSTGVLTDADKAKLLDKVWYNTDPSGGVALEFLSSGVYREAKSLPGSWSWVDKGDFMNVTNNNGSSYQYQFVSVTNTTMSLKSSQGGQDFKYTFNFSDTE